MIVNRFILRKFGLSEYDIGREKAFEKEMMDETATANTTKHPTSST